MNGRRVWQARVAFRGQRTSRLCASRDEARSIEAELLQGLQAKTDAAQAAALAPATLTSGPRWSTRTWAPTSGARR